MRISDPRLLILGGGALLNQYRLKDVPWPAWIFGAITFAAATLYTRGKKWDYFERHLRLGILTFALLILVALIFLGWTLISELIKGN
jgi:hypothetical protein